MFLLIQEHLYLFYILLKLIWLKTHFNIHMTQANYIVLCFFLRCNAGFVVRNVNCPNSKLMAKEVNCCPCCSGKIPFWCRKGNEKGRTAKFNSAFCLPQWENHRWWSIANHFWWASIYCMVKHSVFCGVADHQLINHFRSCVAQLSGAAFLFGWTIAILHLLSSMDSTVTRQWISLVACLPTAVQTRRCEPSRSDSFAMSRAVRPSKAPVCGSSPISSRILKMVTSAIWAATWIGYMHCIRRAVPASRGLPNSRGLRSLTKPCRSRKAFKNLALSTMLWSFCFWVDWSNVLFSFAMHVMRDRKIKNLDNCQIAVQWRSKSLYRARMRCLSLEPCVYQHVKNQVHHASHSYTVIIYLPFCNSRHQPFFAAPPSTLSGECHSLVSVVGTTVMNLHEQQMFLVFFNPWHQHYRFKTRACTSTPTCLAILQIIHSVIGSDLYWTD